jgi:predicted ATP-dependent endonuclease of OLD family
LHIIDQVEIRYFRSIYNLKLNKLNSINVFSGLNDAGKSNILKALNLFFNGQTERGQELDFYRDFNKQRLEEVRRESVKGRQFIQIKVTFLRGEKSPNTLPNKFTVAKTWYRNSSIPVQTDNLDSNLGSRAKRSLSLFLSSLQYEYIPAIKDKDLFGQLLRSLSKALFDYEASKGDDVLNRKLSDLNEDITRLVSQLNTEFQTATGIQSSVTLPRDLHTLYTSLLINTTYDKHSVPIDLRGDGIKVRYIPSILNYIATLSNKQFIWGFEEPENSLEYGMCAKMADDFKSIYSKKSQLFITTHSPAFIALKGDSAALYRISKHGFQTVALRIDSNDQRAYQQKYESLATELGITQILGEQHKFYEMKIEALTREIEELNRLRDAIRESEKPILLTEGKTDKIILETAWSKLYSHEPMPFRIESCDLLPEDDPSGGIGGCKILQKTLETVRYNSPNIVIGLFDQDKAGLEAFKLDRNYEVVPGNNFVKRHRSGKGYAVLLPTPEGKEDFAKYQTLCIEFYFTEDELNTEIEGRKLGLKYQEITEAVNGIVVDKRPATQIYLAEPVNSTKTFFAEKIVPTFEPKSFRNFELLFDIIRKIVAQEY